MKKENIIVDKTRLFAIEIIKVYQEISESRHEFVMSKQILRSGTSIGANVKEAVRAFSKSDFVYIMNTALKEASETEYWLDLLNETEYLEKNQFEQLDKDIKEIIKVLSSIVKSSKVNLINS